MRRVFVCVGLFAIAGLVRGDTTQRPAWQWTNAERIAATKSERNRSNRVKAAAELDAQLEGRDTTESSNDGDVIDGSRNPELFFPWELFDKFVERITSSPLYRQAHQASAYDFLRADSEWQRVLELVTPVMEAQKESKAVRDRAVISAARTNEIKDALAASHRRQCLAVRDALRLAYAEFGEERVNRFLYESIAPSQSISFAPLPSRGGDSAALKERLAQEDCK